MKKIATMVLMAVLATALTAATIQPFKSSKFDQSAHGWGWGGYKAKPIAFDPETGKYAAFYRQKNASGSGTFGGLTGYVEDGNFENRTKTIQLQESGKWNLRYPVITEGPDGYFFGVGANLIALDLKGSPCAFTVYNPANGSWGINSLLPELLNQSVKDLSFVKNGDNYTVVIVLTEGSEEAPKIRVVTGVSKTPADVNSWIWSTRATFSSKLAQEQYWWRNEVLKISPNGSGILALVDQDPSGLTTDSFLYYKWTKDYGVTWYPEADKEWITIDSKDVVPFIGKDHYWINEETKELIENSSFNASLDLSIDSKGNGRMLAEVRAFDSSGGYGQSTAEGNAAIGLYMIPFNWNGSGYTVGQGSFVAQLNQFEGKDDNGTPVFPRLNDTGRLAKYWNHVRFQIGEAVADDGKSVLYAGWPDRAYGCNVLTSAPLQGISISGDHYEEYIADGYFTFSEDGGKTWATQNFKDANPWMATNITNTSNPALATHEDAFTVAKKGKLVKNGNTYDLSVYAGYQVPDWSQRVIKDDATHLLSDYEANLYVGEVAVKGIGSTSLEDGVVSASDFSLEQNYPNPFNPTTAINFNVDKVASVKLAVYNVQGQEIATLLNGKVNAGTQTVNFNGIGLNSGVYFYKLTVDGQTSVKKMILNK